MSFKPVFILFTILFCVSFITPVHAHETHDKSQSSLDVNAKKENPEGQKQLQRLAKDPKFVAAMNGVMKFRFGFQRGLSEMKPAERADFIEKLRKYTAEHNKISSEQSEELSQQLSKISGMPDKDLADIADNARDLLGAYPIIKTGPAASAQAAYSSHGIEYNLRRVDRDRECNEVCQCLYDCREEARIAGNQAGFDALYEVITDTSVDTMIRWMLLAVKLHEIAEERVECEKTCQEWPEGFDCQTDAECAEDEYCHKPIGNPVNICHGKRADTMPCSGHRKCQSGCCRYHLWTNALQMVCRPADRCN